MARIVEITGNWKNMAADFFSEEKVGEKKQGI